MLAIVYSLSSIIGGKLWLSFGVSDGFHFMRRFVSYIGITLLALLISGWGSALAAVLCPHAGMNQALPMPEDHSCHSTKFEATAANQHHRGEHQEATHEDKMKPVGIPQLQGDGHTALGRPAGTCAHCMSQNELPATPASMREVTLQKREAGKLVVQKTLLITPPLAVSVSRFVPSQHAPPGLSAPKHLIFGVFLI